MHRAQNGDAFKALNKHKDLKKESPRDVKLQQEVVNI